MPNSRKKLRMLSAEPLMMSLKSSSTEKVDFLPVIISSVFELKADITGDIKIKVAYLEVL